MIKKIITRCILVSVCASSFIVAQGVETKNTLDSLTADIILKKTRLLQYAIDQAQTERKEVTRRFDESGNEYFATTNHEVLSVLHEASTQIQGIKKDIRQLYFTQETLKDSDQAITTLRANTVETQEEIKRLTLLLYQIDNEFNDTGMFEDIKLLVKAENSMQVSAQQGYLELLIEALDVLTTEMQDLEKREVRQTKHAFTQKKRLEDKIQAHTDTLETIEQKTKQVEDFIKLYQENQIQFDQQMESLFAGRKQIEESITDVHQLILEGKFNPTWDYESKKEQLYMLQERGNKTTYPLSWPILPIDEINIYFHDEVYYQNNQKKHEGISIKSQLGNAILASDDGIIIKTTNNQGRGINRILVEHKNTTLTAYLYLHDTVVQPGDIVRRGQIIGFGGSNNNTTNTPFMKKPAEITFLVRDVEGFIDPLTLVDLSVINNIKNIPGTLAWKQQIDFQKRPIDLTSITFASGATLEERQQSFLELYAKGVYRNRDLWELAGAGHEIDTSFAICIGFAESTLGNHLSTSNNIGNVGNFDNPDIRTALSTPLAGIQVIYDTLDNALLGDYNRIDELSGYGNKNNGLPIYASSPFNRQNNVLKCLSTIHGYYVPEDYSFRTGLRTQVTNSFQAGGELGVKE